MRLKTLTQKYASIISSPRMLRLVREHLCPHDSWRGEVGSIRRIMISGQMGIGNMVMFTPFLRSLRAGFPKAHIALVFTKRNGSEQIVKESPFVDEIIELDSAEKPLHKRFLIGIFLGLKGWDMGIVRFHGAKPEIVAALVYGRVRYRVGHISSAGWVSKLDYLFNVPVVMSPGSHEVDRHLAIAHTLGLTVTDRKPLVHVKDAEHARAITILARFGISEGDDFVAIHPGTSPIQPWKRWSIKNWNALVRALTALNIAVVVLGSPDERQLVAQVCHGTPAVNVAGECSLRESASILAQSRLLVCMDSGLMHIAAAIGTRVVALFGPTDLKRTYPLGQGHTILVAESCLQAPCQRMDDSLIEGCHYEACMDEIQPEHVLAQVQRVLYREEVESPNARDGKLSVLRVRKK